MSVSHATDALKRHVTWAAEHLDPLLQDPTSILSTLEACAYICPRPSRDGHILVVMRHKSITRNMRMRGDSQIILALMLTILKALSRSKDPMAKVILVHDRRGTNHQRSDQLALLKSIDEHILQHLPGTRRPPDRSALNLHCPFSLTALPNGPSDRTKCVLHYYRGATMCTCKLAFFEQNFGNEEFFRDARRFWKHIGACISWKSGCCAKLVAARQTAKICQLFWVETCNTCRTLPISCFRSRSRQQQQPIAKLDSSNTMHECCCCRY
jgi:hypothetical protein